MLMSLNLIWFGIKVWIYFTTWKKRKSSLLSCQVNIVIILAKVIIFEAMNYHIFYSYSVHPLCFCETQPPASIG